MKASNFVLIVILLLLFLFCGMIFLISGRDIIDCYYQVSIDMERFNIKSSQQNWSPRKVCTDRRTILVSWLRCDQKVYDQKDWSKYADQWIIEKFSFLLPNNGNLLELKKQHNAVCQIYPYLLLD